MFTTKFNNIISFFASKNKIYSCTLSIPKKLNNIVLRFKLAHQKKQRRETNDDHNLKQFETTP